MNSGDNLMHTSLRREYSDLSLSFTFPCLQRNFIRLAPALPYGKAVQLPRIVLQYLPFNSNDLSPSTIFQPRMSAYSSGPTSNYDLHSSAVDNSNHDLLTQQQQQHHLGVPPGQPYQFDPHQEAQQQAYTIQTNGHGEEPQQLPPGAAEKQKWRGNRLRKACDSCSIRKVRVSEVPCQEVTWAPC